MYTAKSGRTERRNRPVLDYSRRHQHLPLSATDRQCVQKISLPMKISHPHLLRLKLKSSFISTSLIPHLYAALIYSVSQFLLIGGIGLI